MDLHLLIVRGIVDRHLNERHGARVEALQDDWRDEASRATLAGKPRRGFYLEHMADRLPALVDEALARRGAL